MSIALIGFGTQGKKRSKILSKQKLLHYIVDPFYSKADSKYITELNYKIKYAFLCTPDQIKYELIIYLLRKNINVLVEKPLYFENVNSYSVISNILKKQLKAKLYVAYNHRFEPNIIRIKKYLKKNIIGKIYSVEMYYGNGTAKLWSSSNWRKKEKKGVIMDLAPHLLDIYLFLFANLSTKPFFLNLAKFENVNVDYAKFGSQNKNTITTFTTSLIDWKNKFEINIIGNMGSLHVQNLCKWGNSNFIYRKRVLPSGKPKDLIIKEKKGDTTWKIEHEYFLKKRNKNITNFDNDMKIKKFIDCLFL